MKVNGKEINGIGFAFNGCHKIYIVANRAERTAALQMGYKVYGLNKLQNVWNNTCPMRFISQWDLSDYYVKQGEQAIFE